MIIIAIININNNNSDICTAPNMQATKFSI